MEKTEMLFLAHARSIKHLSNKNQAIVKMKIAKIIMEQQLLKIEEQERNQDRSQYRPGPASSITSISYTSPPNHEYFGDFVEQNTLQPVNNTSDRQMFSEINKKITFENFQFRPKLINGLHTVFRFTAQKRINNLTFDVHVN